ncbi:MAG: DUF1800 family protein, partial [Luteolibacter sp.]
GGKLRPIEAFPPLDGPFWRLMFLLDTEKLPSGECELIVSCKAMLPAAGSSDGRIFSDTRHVSILPSAKAGDIVAAGECEDKLDTPRSESMGMEPPAVSLDPAASGHRAVALRRSRPSWVIQPEIQEAGLYQWIVRARGTLAGAAYPSLGIVKGENFSTVGTAQLASTNWHRVAIGRPIQLDAGSPWVGLSLANEFNYRNLVLRDAQIDCFELRRVDISAHAGESALMQDRMMMVENAPEADETKNQSPKINNLQCAFFTLLDGMAINGSIQLQGMLHARGPRNDNDYRLIQSDLWVNGERHSSAYGKNPSFTIHPHELVPGGNSVKITARSACGAEACSLQQTILATASAHPSNKPDLSYDCDRYDLRRGMWHEIQPTKPDPEGPLVGDAMPASVHDFTQVGSSIRFEIPSQVTGKRRISILAHSLSDPKHGVLSVKIQQPKARQKALRDVTIATLDAVDAWDWQALAAIELDEGPKFLSIELVEGRAALGGVSIDTAKFVDATVPEIEILYPVAEAQISNRGDALVLRAFDDLKLSHFELQIDDRPSPLSFHAGSQAGPIVLHLPASLLRIGKSKLAVTAVDGSGKRSTAQVSVEVIDDHGQVLSLPYPRAVRIADRLAYGPDTHTLAQILTLGEVEWLHDQCQIPEANSQAMLIEALAGVMFPEMNDYHVRGRVICQLLATHKPLAARFALFAQNHFSTWISKSGASAKWEEHRRFSELGVTRFHDLLLCSVTSPAMMVYLDQHSNFQRQQNENYARELMELHTVGVHGGYSQKDVTDMAQLLTGWGAQREASSDGASISYHYRFSPYLHHAERIEVFGLALEAASSSETADDRILQLVEMLASRPRTAHFISRKFAAQYIGEECTDETIAMLARNFMRSGGSFASLLRSIVASPELMKAKPAEKLMNPAEFGVSAQRAADVFHPWSIVQLGDRSGRNLFDRASPDGYPDANAEYADSNYQLQKWSYCKEIGGSLANNLPWAWFDAKPLSNESHRNAVIEHSMAAHRGMAPRKGTCEALHAILTQDVADQNKRRILFSSLLHMMPEFQTR